MNHDCEVNGLKNNVAKKWKVDDKLLYALIFLSGVAALIYELIWIRQMNLVFGVGHFAVATVISIFLLGLGVGSIIFGHRAEKSGNVLKIYAYLELGIGLTSLIAFILLQYTPIFSWLHAYSYNHLNLYMLSIVRFFLAAFVLIIPSIAIGGTVPLVTKFLIRSNKKLGSQFSTIYYINTLGAFLGVLLTGFLLVKFFGVTNTLFGAVLINILIFLLILVFKKRENQATIFSENKQAMEQDDHNFTPKKDMLPILFLTGFIALGFEILWIRVLTNFGSSTTLASTLILGGFLLGFVLGSFYIAMRIDRIKNLFSHFSIYAITVGGLGAVVLFIFSRLNTYFSVQFSSYATLLTESWIGFGLSLIIATAIGTLFPLGLRLYVGNKEMIGKKIGKVYLVNSIGTIIGSMATGFIFIPFLGIKATASVLITLSFIVAAYTILKRVQKKFPLIIFLAGAVVISTTILITSSNTFHRHIEGEKELYYAEGLSATVTVYQQKDGSKYLNVDSEGVAGTYPSGFIDSKILAHLPLSLVENPNSAVTVGYGSGGTSYSMLLHDIEVYALEIEEKVIEASREFIELNHHAEANPSLHIIIDDARNYLNNINMNFDAIVTDVTNLKYKSNPYLYTEDYFQIMKDKLTPEGVAAAWVPLGGLSFNDLKILIASFHAVYPHTTAWFFNQEATSFLIIIGTPEKLMIDINDLEKKIEPVAEDLTSINLNTKYEFSAMLLLGEQDINNLVENAMLHTDDRPILEFSDLDYYYGSNPFVNLTKLFEYQKEKLLSYFTFNKKQEQALQKEFNRTKTLMKNYAGECL